MGNERGHHGPVIESKDGVSVIDCSVCGFRHIDPLPDPEELEELYRNQFYQVEKDGYQKHSDEDLEWRILEFSERFETVERELQTVAAPRVLDVGSGPGDFLMAGHQRGWNCLGIEPSAHAAQFARDRGLDIVEGFFDESMLADLGQFHFVHLSEVLEHVPDPASIIQLAKRCLTPDGIIAVSVPNDYNPFQHVYCEDTGAPHWWVVPRHHLNYFDFVSLEKLFCSQGMEPFARSTNFPMELFLLTGQDYIKDPSQGRALHHRRKAFDLAMFHHDPGTRNAFYSALAQVGLGRLAIVFARCAGS